MNPETQRSGFPLLMVAVALLFAAVTILLLVADPFTDGSRLRDANSGAREEIVAGGGVPSPVLQTAPDAPVEPREALEGAGESQTPLQESALGTGEIEPTTSVTDATHALESDVLDVTPVIATHAVVRGDTLFDLAARYWSDAHLWPMLLVANLGTVPDPDFLRQGLVLSIPPLQEMVAREIAEAHVEAYRRYRALGDEAQTQGRERGDLWLIQLGMNRVNKAHWVLYSGLRYDDRLLERAAGSVPGGDLDLVRQFVVRFGGAPGT